MSKQKNTPNTENTAAKVAPVATIQKTETPLFGKQNYMLFGIGVGLLLIGFALMIGGRMPSPDVWDENLIYGFRRITLAPIVMLSGLSVVVAGIFRK